MRGRIGWWALAAVSVVLLIASAAIGAVLVVRATQDGLWLGTISAACLTAAAAGFWWWILTSIRLRLERQPDIAAADSDPIGPWGIVGRALLAMILVGWLGLWLWADVETRPALERAEAARDEAVRLAQDRDLTAADVEAALAPYDDLLPLTKGTIVDVAVDGDRASILISTDDSPPCAAVDITHGDIVRGRIAQRC